VYVVLTTLAAVVGVCGAAFEYHVAAAKEGYNPVV
jgi:hypothetical protein